MNSEIDQIFDVSKRVREEAFVIIIPVRISGAGSRRLLLELGSGTNIPFLYDPDRYLDPGLQSYGHAWRSGDGVQREFVVLPPQNMQISSQNIPQIAYYTSTKSGKDAQPVARLQFSIHRFPSMATLKSWTLTGSVLNSPLNPYAHAPSVCLGISFLSTKGCSLA